MMIMTTRMSLLVTTRLPMVLIVLALRFSVASVSCTLVCTRVSCSRCSPKSSRISLPMASVSAAICCVRAKLSLPRDNACVPCSSNDRCCVSKEAVLPAAPPPISESRAADWEYLERFRLMAPISCSLLRTFFKNGFKGIKETYEEYLKIIDLPVNLFYN